MKRAYYDDTVKNFILQDNNYILGDLATNNQFALDDLQRNTWLAEIDILKNALVGLEEGHIIFEYTIPRIGNRIDNVLICNGLIFLLEFKVGERNYPKYAINQVADYALDLKNFHKESHVRTLIPILIATKAETRENRVSNMKEGILGVLRCNAGNLRGTINMVISKYKESPLIPTDWINAQYMPTPTIIEAAQALYRNHTVEDISRNDASAANLGATMKAINAIIEEGKQNNKKSICFITGVPGAGKTLAGLNIAIERQKADENEHAVFLSGNGPLVDVLQEALARDKSKRDGIRKIDAMRRAKEFIQIIHHFRDDAISVESPPIEKVAIFDEAQRAWSEELLTDFMARKKGQLNFNMSEPQFLINIMDRHKDWAVIICLVGGGQEINKGEAGISEWFDAIKREYANWNVYVSDKITDSEYSKGLSLSALLNGMKYEIIEDLHLSVPLRSFRSEKVSAFVKALLDVDKEKALSLYQVFNKDYPIRVTRDINKAKAWVIEQANGTERYGITASSGARRLKSYGIWVQSKIDAKNWFLNDATDVRSSYYMEDTATEFDIQGLELDWTVVCWDANFRFVEDHFQCYSFTGSKWMNMNKSENAAYLKNAYRVLLTRARQGFVIFVPKGDRTDATRSPEYYDGIYEYLISLGINSI